jgi:membrane-bound lytic murein transglycosylase MltF
MDRLNQHLFSLAAYNAGPRRIQALRRQAPGAGRDPNRWFDHVEVLAARQIGREPVTYVTNVYKYTVAYRLIVQKLEHKARQKENYSPPGGMVR